MTSKDDTGLVSIDRGRRPVDHIQHVLQIYPALSPALVLAIMASFFALWLGSTFASATNVSLIVQQVMILGVLGLAQTLVILTAGIDLSIGAIMVLASVVMGRLAVVSGLPTILAMAIGIGVGAACGLINGLLVSRLRLPAFIATLGTWQIFLALTLWYSGSSSIRAREVEESANFLRWAGNTIEVFGARITYGSLIMLALFVVFWYVLTLTSWGRHVYAAGDDVDAARLVGIRTDRVLLSTYIVAGVVAAIAGWLLIGRIGAVSPRSGTNANLDSVTAVVIGGTSLFGGRGRIVGTLIGALVVGVLRNGLALGGVDVLWQNFSIGVLIITAIATDQWIRRVGR